MLGQVEMDWAWEHEEDLVKGKEERFSHEERGVFSFPADVLPPRKLDLPTKTGPKDIRSPAQTSKNCTGFEECPIRQDIIDN